MTNNKISVRHNVYSLIISIGLAVGIIAAILFGVLCSTPTQAKADEIADIQAEINQASSGLDALSRDYYEALEDQQEAQAKVDEAHRTIEENKIKIAALKKQISKRSRAIYRNSTLSGIIGCLFEAKDFIEFANNLDYLNSQSIKDGRSVTKCIQLKEENEQQEAILNEQLAVATAKTDEAAAIKNNAESTLNALNAKLNSLTADQQAAMQEQQRQESEKYKPSGGGDIPPGGGDGGSTTIYNNAVACVGKIPYVWGGCSPSGCDCSGFVSHCCTGGWTRLGTTYTFLGWPRVSNPGPGNICVNEEHCGIYAGGGSMIHAPCSGQMVSYGGVQGGMVFVKY
ncbi:MAG: hypothetical protein Q4E88_04540 [Coriobacteriia bacterium]|nr:hypothetical protein [Coriobacteriia bacterium]